MSATITLSHVAREAGVSPSTVSRILNGTAHVKPEKRERVERVIKQLGYQPNVMAQGLARGQSMSIGVLAQDISSPYYGEAVAGIERGLNGSGYHPVVVSGHWRVEQEREALKVLLGRQVDALIVLGGRLDDDHLRRIAANIPLIAIGRSVMGLEAHCMRVDNLRGAYLATHHLIERGHRRIAHIAGPQDNDEAVERLAGYRSALEEAAIAFDPQIVVEGNFAEQSGLIATEALFARASLFTSIFIANDQMAYGARLALYRHGVRVPDDVSIVAFDDLSSSNYTTPPLTTVRQSIQDMSLAAAHAVLALLSGKPVYLPRFEVSLVIRESTAVLHNRGGMG